MSRFGQNLRAAREAAGLTQEQLKQRLGFKRTTPLSIWERGHKVPGPKVIDKLATAIGCTTAVLMQGVVTPYDRLRGSIAAVDDLRVLDEDREMYRHWRTFPAIVRRRWTEAFAALAAASSTTRTRGAVATGARGAAVPRASVRRRR